MTTSSVAFALFAVFSALRIFSYLPQIYRVAHDSNGASAISYATWSFWVGANLATAFYAAANLGDLYLASVSTAYAACCAIVIALTAARRRSAARRTAAETRRLGRPNLIETSAYPR
jgi:hypothetical protein